jgi:two-component system, NtrC family, C4-dicarboxylate transport response regulator DctD
VNFRERRRAYLLRQEMIVLDPPLVLLAEDDDEVRRVVATALRIDGYSVVEARDGHDLVARITAARLFGKICQELTPITLVIADVRMPGRDGLTVLEDLRGADIEVPVILMTAYADARTRERATRFGADFVAKPFELDHLRDVVQRALATPAS